MSAQPGPLTRLRTSLSRGNLLEARAAATELPVVPLRDALGLVELIALKEPGCFDAAARRWLERLLSEVRDVDLLAFAIAASALAQMRDPAFIEFGGSQLRAATSRLSL